MTPDTPLAGPAVRDASVAILKQLAGTLAVLDDEQYTTPGPSGATVGAHVRHTLDHYRKLADGYTNGTVVAYDQRVRGGSIETDRAEAIREAGQLAGTFSKLDETQMSFPVTIRAMVTGEGNEAEMESTLVRELWFASHHAIHHNALLKPIASAVGVDLPPEFGRAPSTVNHETTSA
jgi:uncharacterized damage-inducible protein DinB